MVQVVLKLEWCLGHGSTLCSTSATDDSCSFRVAYMAGVERLTGFTSTGQVREKRSILGYTSRKRLCVPVCQTVCPAWACSESCGRVLPRGVVQCGGPACPEPHQRGSKVQADPRGTRQGPRLAMPSLAPPTPASDRAWLADCVLVCRRRGKRRASGTGPGAASCTSCRPGRSTRYLSSYPAPHRTPARGDLMWLLCAWLVGDKPGRARGGGGQWGRGAGAAARLPAAAERAAAGLLGAVSVGPPHARHPPRLLRAGGTAHTHHSRHWWANGGRARRGMS